MSNPADAALPIDAALFRETLGHYPTGVAVITGVVEDGSLAGMVVGTFNSVSLDPPLIAFFPTKDSPSFALLRTATSFCVNVLAADQEDLCRRFITGRDAKFDGIGWRPGPLGAPILNGVVSWLECTFHDVLEAGDHYIALGLVNSLAVERSTLPLLFFQGGFGRFTPRSLVAAPDPELIQASQLAQAIREDIEALSSRFRVNCAVVAKIGGDGVHVLTAERGPVPDSFPLGHRMPVIPPMGAGFLVNASDEEVEAWLAQAPKAGEERREQSLKVLRRVRDRGASVLTATDPEAIRRHREAVTAFEQSDRLPRQQGALQQATLDLADFYEAELVPGKEYEVESIVVPVAAIAGYPPLVLRMTGMPSPVSTEQIGVFTEALHEIADIAAARLG